MEVTGKRVNMDDTTKIFCEPCEVENSQSPANGGCRECKEYMCNTCFRHHLKSKHSRNHVLLSLDEFLSPKLDSGSEDVTKCEKHDNEVIKFYCRSHDVVGCGDCIVLEHTSCKPEYIKDLAKTFADGDMYKVIVRRVEDLEDRKINNGIYCKNRANELQTMDEKALKEIRKFRAEINKCLDDAEANILLQIKKLTQENDVTQTKIEKTLQELSSELEKVKQMIDTELHRDNVLFINAMSCRSRLLDIEKVFENKEQDGMLKRFEFVQNEHMLGLLKSAEPLGNLKIETVKETMKQMKFDVGVRVRRGPNWRYWDQDGRGPGTLKGFNKFGLASVIWDNGYTDDYRIGQQNKFDLKII